MDRMKRWPDLTGIDFYLWGLLKDVVYRGNPPTLEELREEMETSCTAIPVDTLATVARALVRRIQKWLQINGEHYENFLLIFIVGRDSQLGTAVTAGLLYQPHMIDDGDCEAIGGMKIGRGNRITRRKPASAPLCPPQIPHDQTRARTRAAVVGRQQLTAWSMVWLLKLV
jgi:hypothetical protein